jgi:hypothetical protein
VGVRLDRKATSIALLVVIDVRADGQKVLLAIKAMGGQSTEALASGDRRSSCGRPGFLIVDGARPRGGNRCGVGRRASAALHGHKHRNLLAHAPQRLHEEITADHNDMIYAAMHEEVKARRMTFIRKMAAQASRRRRQPAGSRRPALRVHAATAEPMAQRWHHQRDRAAAPRVQTTDQNADRAAIGGHCGDAVLGTARFRPDQHAQS